VIEDVDISRAAKLLVDQHGTDAALWAAQRADAPLKVGDVDGARYGGENVRGGARPRC
jgi:hypothetical protein